MVKRQNPRSSRTAKALLRAVADTPSSSTAEVASSARVSKHTAARILGRLRASGMVNKSASQWDRRCNCWNVTGSGLQFLQGLSEAAE